MHNITLEFLSSIVGVVVSTTSLIFLITTFHRGPRGLQKSIFQLIIGIAFIAVAFLWDIIFTLATPPALFSFDAHHLLMAISTIFFVNAARKFYNFGR